MYFEESILVFKIFINWFILGFNFYKKVFNLFEKRNGNFIYLMFIIMC